MNVIISNKQEEQITALDIDIIKSINDKAKAVVQMTLTTFDEDLCRILEPNVATTKQRFETLMKFKEAGVPTVVWLCPVLIRLAQMLQPRQPAAHSSIRPP